MNAFKDTFKTSKERIKNEVDEMSDEARKWLRSKQAKLMGASFVAGALLMGIIFLAGRCAG